MVRTLIERVSAAQRYVRFLSDAADADAVMQESGIGYAMKEVHAYVAARVRGEPVKRPHSVKWRE